MCKNTHIQKNNVFVSVHNLQNFFIAFLCKKKKTFPLKTSSALALDTFTFFFSYAPLIRSFLFTKVLLNKNKIFNQENTKKVFHSHHGTILSI